MLTGVNDLTNILGPQRPQGSGGSNGELGQEEYFALMVAQLRNQDPTSPQDGSEYFTQIAQFGTVNGITELQQSFDSLATALNNNQALSASSLIDRDVLLPGGFGYLTEGEPLSGQVDLPQGSSALRIEITDEAGRRIRVLNLGQQNAGGNEFTWDGLDESGNPAPSGRYNITAEATYGNESVAVEVLVAGRVESVAFGGFAGQTVLTVSGLGPVGLSDVRGIQ